MLELVTPVMILVITGYVACHVVRLGVKHGIEAARETDPRRRVDEVKETNGEPSQDA